MHEGRRTTARGLTGRTAEPEGAVPVRVVLDDWREQRLHHCVQPRHSEHYGDTTLIIAADGDLFSRLSQRFSEVAYVPSRGVRQDHRRCGLGLELFRRFAATGCEHGRTVLRAETGAFDHRSIAFHRSIGFTIEPGDEIIGGVAVHHDAIGGDYGLYSMDLRTGPL